MPTPDLDAGRRTAPPPAEPFDLLAGAAHSEGEEATSREAALVAHFLAGRATSDLGQILLGALSIFWFWPFAPPRVMTAWAATFAVAAVARPTARTLAVRRLDDPARTRWVLRVDVWASALLWAPLPLMVGGGQPTATALVLVCFAGLIGAATSTMVADATAFIVFMVLLEAPLCATFVHSGLTRIEISMLMMIALYAPFMVITHRRGHRIPTDQIDSNQRLRASEAEATRRKDFVDALVANAPNHIVVLDEFSRIRYANPAFEHAIHSPVSRLLGRRITDIISDPTVAAATDAFVKSLEAGKRSDTELDLAAIAGRASWMRLTGTRAGGAADGLAIVSGVDITESVESRRTLEEANRRASEAARAKSSFLASMSHEIRTPMNGILGMIGLLVDTELTREQRDSLGVVQRSAEALLRILNDILDVSKIEAGQLDLEEIGFDLPQLVSETARVFTPQAWARSTELAIDMADFRNPWVTGDPVRLRQVLSNLLSNAVKFTDEGEVVLSALPITDPERVGAPVVRFSVRDTGIGIPAEKHHAIFGEFEQADQSTTRTHGGTGLGLTISRRLVEMMGGRLELDSEVGAGSTFSFEIPLPFAEERTATREPARGCIEGCRFLVVDDNDTARRIVREVLVAEGAKADEASGVDSGLRLLSWAAAKDSPYAAVILDHLMPNRDGFDFARDVAANDEVRGTPILMLTSSGDTAQREEARKLGIGAYLSKPVARPDLVRAVGELLGHADREGPERRLVTETTLSRARPLRILVAEDNTVNQHVAKAMLGKRGHTVDIVGNGALALEAVLEKPYDLVLMDIQMPVMDGHEATRRIRAHKGLSTLPIVAVTAHVFAEERERCRESGMNDFLAKPMKPAELFEVLDRWTADRRGHVAVNGGADADGDGDAGEPVTVESPPVDVDAFRAVMRDAGIEEIVDETLALYTREAPVIVERLRSAVAAGDCPEVNASAHMLKSSSANIRADALAELLYRMERAGGSGDLGEIGTLMPEIEVAYAAVLEHLAGVAAS